VLIISSANAPGGAQDIPIFQLTNPAAVKLLDEVSQTYNKRTIAIDTALPANVHAAASIAEDGTPIIKVPIDRDPTEADLVHELFHLKLIAEGYAFIRIDGGAQIPQVLTTRLFEWVKDPIEHTIFYPRMKAMGLNPSEHVEATISNARARFAIEPGEPSETSVLSLFALRVALQDKPELFEKFIQGKTAGNDLAVAEHALEILVRDRPQTPDEEISTVVKVLNCLLPSVGTFSFGHLEAAKKGTVTVRTAVIRIDAPSGVQACPAN
jgi:hypothetical protein